MLPGMGGREREPGATRRVFLKTASLAALSVYLSPSASARAPFRRLRMLHTHTGERIDVTYQEEGEHLPDALSALDRFLRDFRTGEVHPIDPGVLDLAATIAAAAERP